MIILEMKVWIEINKGAAQEYYYSLLDMLVGSSQVGKRSGIMLKARLSFR